MGGSSLLPSHLELSQLNHVQELAIQGYEPAPRYILKDGPITEASSSSTIPVVDLSLILSASAPAEVKQQEMEKFRSSLSSWGFFQAIGHGLSDAFLDEVRNIGKEFFDLPLDEKKKYAVNFNSGEHHSLQGYGNDRILSEEQTLDWTDRLYLLVKPQEQRTLNFWPEYPKQFREILHEYSIKTTLLAQDIVKSMAKVVDLEENCFNSQFGEESVIYARFNYYPPCSKSNLVYGIKPHTDGGGVTILLQDKQVEGLQIFKDGEWFKVPIVPYALVVNIADQMEIMSNGMFKSALHRVVPDPKKERISLAMFYAPQFENEIGPVDGLIDETRPMLFKKMKYKDYLETFMEKFLQGSRGIDTAKV